MEEELSYVCAISGVGTQVEDPHGIEEDDHDGDELFDIGTFNKRIICSLKVEEGDVLQRSEDGARDSAILHKPNTFVSKSRHTDVSAQDLSDRWLISVGKAVATLKKTTQRFTRSAILPLARRYRADRVFSRKTLSGVWSTDTMDGRIRSLDGNQYAQVFGNKSYFAKIYPMDSKSKSGNALRLFCQEFGVPEKLVFNGSKEQCGKNTEFMKQVRKNDINYQISEPDYHNQNPVEGVIREVRKKWFRTMIRKRVPKKLWDYGVVWASEIMSITHSSAGSLGGCIPMTEVTGAPLIYLNT